MVAGPGLLSTSPSMQGSLTHLPFPPCLGAMLCCRLPCRPLRGGGESNSVPVSVPDEDGDEDEAVEGEEHILSGACLRLRHGGLRGLGGLRGRRLG